MTIHGTGYLNHLNMIWWEISAYDKDFFCPDKSEFAIDLYLNHNVIYIAAAVMCMHVVTVLHKRVDIGTCMITPLGCKNVQ